MLHSVTAGAAVTALTGSWFVTSGEDVEVMWGRIHSQTFTQSSGRLSVYKRSVGYFPSFGDVEMYSDIRGRHCSSDRTVKTDRKKRRPPTSSYLKLFLQGKRSV